MMKLSGASKQYVHLAMAHGAGHADSTILGKNGVFKKKLKITSFGAVPKIIERKFAAGDSVSLYKFISKYQKRSFHSIWIFAGDFSYDAPHGTWY